MSAAQDNVRIPRSMKRPFRKRPHWRVLAIVLGMLLSQVAPAHSLLPLGLSGPTAAHAAGAWYVDQSNSSASDSNSCTSSSSPCKTIGGALGKAVSGDTINVNPGTYDEHLTVGINLTLSGAGASSTIIDGTNSGTVVAVNGGAMVTLSGLTFQHGTSTNGGGINNSAGSLTLKNVVVASNAATANGAGIYTGAGTVTTISNSSITGNTIDSASVRVVSGGGIYNQGTLTIDRSTIANNLAKTELSSRNTTNISASASGGGIDNLGTLTVTNSSVINNTAAYPDAAAPAACPGGGGSLPAGDCFGTAAGAGIANESAGTLALTNSTVSGNNVTTYDGNGLGGGIWNAGGTLGLTNATISANNVSVFVGPAGAASFAYGGGLGVGNSATAVSLRATILANNNFGGGGSFNGPDCSTNFASAGTSVTSQGYNLIRDTSSCSVGGNTTSNVTGQDPLLGPLQNNGGPTQTMLPGSGSPAIGASPCTDSSNNPIRTDQRGVSRPVSACTIGAIEADRANDTWTSAFTLDQNSGSSTSYQLYQTVSDHIYAPTQERWYKFQITPGSLVHVSYTGDPGAIVSLHSDIQSTYNALTAPANAAVESATRASSGFLPQEFLPQEFLPQEFLPQEFLPQEFLPQEFLPQEFLPQEFLPQEFLPQEFLPQEFLPQEFLPGPYSGSIDASLLTLSAIPNSSTQTIDHYTWNGSGYFYVRVVGPPDRNNAFQITVTETGGVCSGSSAFTTFPATQPANIPTGKTTLILWDPSRIVGSSSDISTLSGKLSTFAGRSEVNGTVIDLSQNTGVESAEGQADNHPGCPAAKNVVANDVKSVIQAYRAQNSNLKYIVLVGDDHSIPYFRYPDEAGLGPENGYYPPVADTSASNASLRNNYVLGQDEYGASFDLPISDLSLPIPDLPVGRLVATAADVSHMLDVYTNANGTLTPSSALVTGYDFVADAACGAEADLAAGMPTSATIDTLIRQGTQPLSSSCPASSTAWTASDVSQKLLGNRHDIVFMAGHFSAGALEASDYSTSLSAATVALSPVDMTGSLVLALGCHGGYNIPGGDSVPNFSPSPDWPEAFARKGATLLAATGYAYGDTDFTEYGEHLFDNYVKQLRSYSGTSYAPVALGPAEVAAKKEYLATHTNLSGVDEKTLLETTLYGLPMMTVNMTGQHISTQSDTSIVSSAPTVSSGPGQSFGLEQGQTATGSPDIDVTPSLTSHTETLTNGANNTPVTATYLSGGSGVVARPGEPVFPSQVYNVHVPNQILRGVGFRGGSYSDTPGITPLTSAAGTETAVGHPAFYTNVFYPMQVWTPNYFAAIGGGSEHLATTPAQYISSSPTSTSGTLRQFSDLKFRLFYLPSSWISNPPTPTTIQAAEAAAPTISSVSAISDSSGNVTFNVHVLSDRSAGTQDVWITYTNPSSPGTWQSIDLTQSGTDPTLWTASRALSSSIVFMVQAVNGTGLVSLSTNSGAYFTVGSTTPPALAQTTISLQSPPNLGTFQTTATFNVLLQSNGAALANQLVTVNVGGQQGFGTTNGSGVATITVPLAQPPGTYNVTASFAGASGYQASTQTLSGAFAFQITPAPTTLTLTPSSTSMPRGASVPITATLQDGGGNGLAQKAVVFTLSNNTVTYQTNVFTDSSGRAQLGLVSVPAGSYSVTAAFGGQDHPLQVTIGGNTVTEQDPDYKTPAPPPAVTLNLYQYQPAGTTCDGDAGHAILQPVNADGSSVFKQGSAVPLKFRVCDANGNSVGPTAAASTVVTYFTLVKAVSNCSTCSVDENIFSANPDTAFRWDPTNLQWIYNLSTKNLTSGTTYSYDIALNDGTHIDFSFAVK